METCGSRWSVSLTCSSAPRSSSVYSTSSGFAALRRNREIETNTPMKIAMCSGSSSAAKNVTASVTASPGVECRQMRSSFRSKSDTAFASTSAASTLCGMHEMSGAFASPKVMPRQISPQKIPEKRVAAPEA